MRGLCQGVQRYFVARHRGLCERMGFPNAGVKVGRKTRHRAFVDAVCVGVDAVVLHLEWADYFMVKKGVRRGCTKAQLGNIGREYTRETMRSYYWVYLL